MPRPRVVAVPVLGYLMPLLLLFGAAAAPAATFFGPLPYRCFDGVATAGCGTAESPFASDIRAGNFQYFHLEDLEDGLLNAPGLTASAGAVLAPGALTDSVDGDDGLIDGLGTAGWSILNGQSTEITFSFDEVALGRLPTHVGLAWTDVGFAEPTDGFDEVSFEAFDGGGGSLGVVGPTLLGDGLVDGRTGEDRFYGVINLEGVSSVVLRMATSLDWELDHIQYGAHSGVGGSVTGLDLSRVACTNRTTGESVVIDPAGAAAWNCQAAGLEIASGDALATLLVGAASGSGDPIAGAVTLTALARATCTNLDSGQTVNLAPGGGSTWDCTAAGFAAAPGDRVRVRLTGSAS